MIKETKLDKRRKYYCILDCETATLTEAANYGEKEKKDIAIAKPLIYDLGWIITDKNGFIYRKRNFLVAEIFGNYQIFQTAYYKDKRPLYINLINKNEIVVESWNNIIKVLLDDLSICVGVGAYNAMFDFKKAIPFTDDYITNYYSSNWERWHNSQIESIKRIANGNKPTSKDFDGENFNFRSKNYPLFDIWGMACEFILNSSDYKEICIKNGWLTASGKYFKTSAECAFRFCETKNDFIESHTALDDAEIETKIFAKAVKKNKNKVKFGLTYFPFKLLGLVEEFCY